jgi:hypothetical protein
MSAIAWFRHLTGCIIFDMGDIKAKRARRFTGRGVLLVFSICALADFVWALLEKRSLAEAAISAVLGLFGTGLYLLMYWAADDKNDPDDPNWPARMVP